MRESVCVTISSLLSDCDSFHLVVVHPPVHPPNHRLQDQPGGEWDPPMPSYQHQLQSIHLVEQSCMQFLLENFLSQRVEKPRRSHLYLKE